MRFCTHGVDFLSFSYCDYYTTFSPPPPSHPPPPMYPNQFLHQCERAALQVDTSCTPQQSPQPSILHTPLCTSTPVTANAECESELSDSSESLDSSTCDTSSSDSNQDASESTLEDLCLPLDLSPSEICPAVSCDSLQLNETTLSVVPEACTIADACTVPQSVNAGYKIVFDNIDKTIKPRHMTADSQTTSLHYVQAYAVKDRVDYSHIGSEREGECNLYDILPNSEDYVLLKERFAVLVSRCIVAHLDFFKNDFKGLVQSHIPHKYSAEMCMKSEVVSEVPLISHPLMCITYRHIRHINLYSLQIPLGVLAKNETKYDDMIDILEEYKKYVPSSSVTLQEPIPESNVTEDKSCYHTSGRRLLICGTCPWISINPEYIRVGNASP